jgi:glycosyltransferase involved in cell wall biosynthesis
MKIFLPFKVKDIGGTSTFAQKFAQGMHDAGHEVVFEYTEDYDVLFLIVQCPLEYVRDAKRRGKKIVQRLDGTYYWTVSGWKFPLMNLKAAIIRHFFTDVTIYQSEYSRESANRFLGKKRRDTYEIIYNGVDLELFTPKGPAAKLRDSATQHVFFTASAFRRKDQIAPILEAMTVYRERYTPDCKLVIAGTFIGPVSEVPNQLRDIPWVELLGKVKNADLPAYERAADAFLCTHLNPPCPNNIIESLAAGLPVVGLTDGAMPELVTSGKDGELLPVQGNGYWRQRRFDAAGFAAQLHRMMQHETKYAAASRKAAVARFALSDMIGRYVQVFELLVK